MNPASPSAFFAGASALAALRTQLTHITKQYKVGHSGKDNNFFQFGARQKWKKIVIKFSAYEPPVAMAVDDFVENGFAICTNLMFLPKIILVAAADLGAVDPKIVEIDPM